MGLLTGASTKMTGDTAAMLDARAAFQGAGHFAPIAAAVAQAFGFVAEPEHTSHVPYSGPVSGVRPSGSATSPDDTTPPDSAASPDKPGLPVNTGSPGGSTTPRDAIGRAGGAVLEIGAGTGYYLAQLLDAHPRTLGIALDVAKPAARRAARAHPRLASILADAWRGLPIRDGALNGVLSVFAPRNPAEVARVLGPGGRFVVVTPTSRHLGELIEPLGMVRVDPDKDRRLEDALSGTFTRTDHTLVEFPMKLSRADVTNVVAMGPSAFHGTPADDPRIAALADFTQVTASVTVATYAPVG
ncbi:23S rRNA (guanine745-N1)-methyltransferase [Nocardia caishijiensis]|uniref:23S rRNA (Guanine745-N1)-methyltransferase n=1 Tax=Nocardia caishijiensis TaxID=184756 RepID=A0ABQ6YK54_9NOCA|nr:methyltransferase domain-containing protein [Nocardia caishijiensis]KAF0846158.1 23S rRNA (guanine745-N1)-methyltransferase [Nocardia caishijiensis]